MAEQPRPSEREMSALHEAAHVVVGRSQGRVLNWASLQVTDENRGQTSWLDEPDDPMLVIKKITATWAGVIVDDLGSGGDLDTLEAAERDLGSELVHRLAGRAARVLMNSQEEWARVTKMLLERTTILGDDFEDFNETLRSVEEHFERDRQDGGEPGTMGPEPPPAS